ncbi:S1 RNA-binding domain-containing protein [Nocardia sp. NPDC050193]
MPGRHRAGRELLRDRHSEPATSDHGRVEAAYLQAVAAFAEATDIDLLAIREPEIGGIAHFGLEPPVDGYGLADLFPADLTGFHDGALVPVAVGLELVRTMLRDNCAWCRLETEECSRCTSAGTSTSTSAAAARAKRRWPAPARSACSRNAWTHRPTISLPTSPHMSSARPTPASGARLRWAIGTHRATFLEETYAANASRWHRLTSDNLEAVRAGLTPRARLAVWPDLLTDVGTAMASLPGEGLVEILWEDESGRITGTVADDTQFEAVISRIAGARAAGVLFLVTDERHPLFTAVLPDSDGVLGARWQTEPTPSDRDRAFLKALRRGRVVTGTVTSIADFGGTFVDIGGFTAMIDLPELSWRPVHHPSDVVGVGRRITAEILDVDMVRERVALSLRQCRKTHGRG